jgi:hypothetical protein
VLILSGFSEDKTRVLISTRVGKIFKVIVTTRTEKSKYYVGESEKDFMLKVFGPLKDCTITIEELSLDSHSDDLNMSTSTSLNIPEI